MSSLTALFSFGGVVIGFAKQKEAETLFEVLEHSNPDFRRTNGTY